MASFKTSLISIVCAGTLSSVAAIPCTFASGSCTLQPCPDSLFFNWLECVQTPAATCPTGACKVVPNSDPMGDSVCVIASAETESISTAEITEVLACLDAPNAGCVLANAGLLQETGCTTCLEDLIALNDPSSPCAGAPEATCETIDTPTCPGDAMAPGGGAMPPDAEGPMPGMGPMAIGPLGPMMAPAPGPSMAPSPAAMAPTGLEAEVNPDGTTRAADGTVSADGTPDTTGAAAAVCGAVSAAVAVSVAMLL